MPPVVGTGRLGEAQPAFLEAIATLPSALGRTLFWALRLMQQREPVQRAWRAVPGAHRVAYGFLDPDHEQNAFGVIIFAAPHVDGPQEPLELEPLLVDDHRFPVVVRRVAERVHAGSGVPHPAAGSATIWARSRLATRPVGPGSLTAKHVTGHTLGAPIPMSCGCTGRVVDVAPPCIDAAMVTCSCATQSLTTVSTLTLVPPGIPVEFSGSRTGRVSTTVTATSDQLGIYGAPAFPIHLVLATQGTRGDSGALVTETVTNRATGLYIGEYRNNKGVTGGIAQHIEQVCRIMDMELLA